MAKQLKVTGEFFYRLGEISNIYVEDNKNYVVLTTEKEVIYLYIETKDLLKIYKNMRGIFEIFKSGNNLRFSDFFEIKNGYVVSSVEL